MFQENSDFFPTPINLARKMIEKLPREWKSFKYVLEPSAGSGNLIEHYKSIYQEGVEIDGRYFKGRDSCDVKFEAIEIDDRLVNILRGKNINVVHNDFLTYRPNKYYDLIFCNLPFSDCEHHLLKCIEIQGRIGGKIVAITSASVLKNPFSNTRQELAVKLQELNADIEYIQDGFIDAERSTGVEIAIIYIDIPLMDKETIFEREFRRDNHDIKFENFNSIAIKRNKLEQLVFEYQLVIDSTIKLFEEKVKIDKLLDGFGLENKVSISNDLTRAEKITVNDFIESTNQTFWDKFITETKFSDRLPSKLKDKFRSNMQKQRNISFNLENVRYFYEELMKAIPESYEENANRIFDELTYKSHYSERDWNKNIHMFNGWKTNDAYKIGAKNIVTFSSCYMYGLPTILTDLIIIFENLSGIRDTLGDKYNGAGKTYYQKILKSIERCEKGIDMQFFTLDVYKKGTIHIKYKDMKLVEQFNVIVSKYKKWLPDGFGTKSYSDMDEEELEVIRNFGIETPEQYQVYSGRKDYLRLS